MRFINFLDTALSGNQFNMNMMRIRSKLINENWGITSQYDGSFHFYSECE